MKTIATNPFSSWSAILILTGVSACVLFADSQRELADADAETFEAVVRSQLTDSAPGGTGVLRVDPRPGTDNPLPSADAKSSPLLILPDSSSSPSKATVGHILEKRSAILGELRVTGGGPFNYPECGGTRRVVDADGLVGTVNCPREPLRYIAVGLPHRGAAPVLDKLRRPELPAPDSGAELWTVLVSETNSGPGGQRWQQYAWLFHRDQETGHLVVGERFLLSWAD